MSGKIKIGGLVLAAALIVLGAWFVFGQANQDPCGGHYVGQALQAKFLSQYTENGSTYDSNIANDLEGVWYRYFVPGGDCIFLFRRGHIVVGVDQSESDRNVVMHFDRQDIDTQMNPGCDCTDPDLTCPPCFSLNFMKDNRFILRPRDFSGVPKEIRFEQIASFAMKLDYKLAATRTDPVHPGILVLEGAGYDVNFGGMMPGDTKYCSHSGEIKVNYDCPTPEEPNKVCSVTHGFYSQVKVYYGELEEGGLGWEVTPIHEPFYFLTYNRVKIGKKDYILEPVYTFHDTSLYQEFVEGTDYVGKFRLPYKLIIKRAE